MSVDATIHERVCSHRAVLLDDQPIGVNSHPATLRLPGNTTLATPRSVVVTYDFGSLEHAVAARPAAVTAAHTPKSAPRVAIDPYRLIDQQDSPVGKQTRSWTPLQAWSGNLCWGKVGTKFLLTLGIR